ncbi:MAG TPA: histidine ammonia-lyase [Firmicutes bacterium]|jgi:histidine ammonia-lyase|nr:histidine ammonia-lyase [Bacillota bacterium]
MLKLRGSSLSGHEVVRNIRQGNPVVLDATQLEKVARARELVVELVSKGQPIYGINTGFGLLANTSISDDNVAELQRNLILSHSCGVGDPFPDEVVKAMMILRANALMKGHSGIRPQVIELLVGLVNKGVTPLIPSQGSVGASGDLVPLAHMSSVLLGEGQAYYEGQLYSGAEALKRAGLSPVILEAKEGLALINGTQAMTAQGVIALHDSHVLLKTADISSSVTIEALCGIPNAFDERVHLLRSHQGQIATAANLRRLLAGSELVYSKEHERIQDAYSLRCIPQVHGASKDAYGYVETVLNTEINSVTDNPILFPQDGDVISAGNFHGQPVALALDFLGIALSEIGNIAERRIERLVNPQLSGLPPFLSEESGLNSGYMIIQYTAASLVSENKVLAHPASVDSIPTSANQEDHVSMGSIAARKVLRILENVQNIIAIELLCACQALEYRDRSKLSPATKAVYDLVREQVPPLKEDRFLEPEIKVARDLVVSGKVLNLVEDIIGNIK